MGAGTVGLSLSCLGLRGREDLWPIFVFHRFQYFCVLIVNQSNSASVDESSDSSTSPVTSAIISTRSCNSVLRGGKSAGTRELSSQKKIWVWTFCRKNLAGEKIKEKKEKNAKKEKKRKKNFSPCIDN